MVKWVLLALCLAASSPCCAAFVPGGIMLSSSSPTLSSIASLPSGARRGARITATKMMQASEEEEGDTESASFGRRLFICGSGAALAAATMAPPHSAGATSDSTVSKFSLQAPPTDKDPLGNKDPFIKFEDGVSYKEYKAGAGDLVVGPGRTVSAQIVGRLLNLNGIKFYSTKEIKDEFGDAPALRWTIGQGQALPGLEEGMMGMRKGSLRKIIVPPAMGYAAGPNLLPQPSAAGRPSLDSVLKNPRRDATIAFEVLIEGIK